MTKLNDFSKDRRVHEAADGAAGAGDAGAAGAAAAPDYSFIPADYVKDGAPDLEAFKTHYSDLVARDAQAAQRSALVPQDGAYDFALAPDVTFEGLDLPDGFTVDLQTQDPSLQPLFADLGATLKELGAPKEAAGKFAQLLARYEATKFSQTFAAHKAEMQALGTPAQQQARIDAVTRSMAAKLPEAQVTALKKAVTTAAGVQALEALLGPRTVTTTTQAPPRADLENMTPMERLRYGNSLLSKKAG